MHVGRSATADKTGSGSLLIDPSLLEASFKTSARIRVINHLFPAYMAALDGCLYPIESPEEMRRLIDDIYRDRSDLDFLGCARFWLTCDGRLQRGRRWCAAGAGVADADAAEAAVVAEMEEGGADAPRRWRRWRRSKIFRKSDSSGARAGGAADDDSSNGGATGGHDSGSETDGASDTSNDEGGFFKAGCGWGCGGCARRDDVILNPARGGGGSGSAVARRRQLRRRMRSNRAPSMGSTDNMDPLGDGKEDDPDATAASGGCGGGGGGGGGGSGGNRCQCCRGAGGEGVCSGAKGGAGPQWWWRGHAQKGMAFCMDIWNS
ncbi:unnamed protein product [Phaeothamnion confervicola]